MRERLFHITYFSVSEGDFRILEQKIFFTPNFASLSSCSGFQLS